MKKPITLICLAWMFIVLVGSLMPGRDLPKINLFQADKVVHLIFYFVLCMLMFFSMVREWKGGLQSRKWLWRSVLAASFFGLFIEILQSNLNTGRYFDTFDVLANTIGALVAAGVVLLKNLK